jgi:hypothetical protein
VTTPTISAPFVRVVHRTSTRTRLRTRGMKGNKEYFEQLRSELSKMTGVHSVQVNPLTESVLLEHEVPIDPLLREAEQRGFLHLDLQPVDDEPYLARIGRALSDSDQKMAQASSGRVNLETLSFLGMLAGGFYQCTRGHALPAGVTMLRYALEFVNSAAKGELEVRQRTGNGGAYEAEAAAAK